MDHVIPSKFHKHMETCKRCLLSVVCCLLSVIGEVQGKCPGGGFESWTFNNGNKKRLGSAGRQIVQQQIALRQATKSIQSDNKGQMLGLRTGVAASLACEKSNTSGYNPGSFYGIVTSDSQYVYKVDYAGGSQNQVSQVLASTYQSVGDPITVGMISAGMAITPDGQFLYVTSVYSRLIQVIQTSSNVIVATINTGGYPCYGIAKGLCGD